MSSADQLAQEGRQMLAEGNVNAAADAFNRALQHDQDNVHALVGLARCLIIASTQDPTLGETAQALLSKALTLQPRYAEAVIYSGVLEESRQNLPAARRHYEKGVALDPSLFVGHFNLGRVAGQMHDWPLAVRELEKAAKLEPENGEGLYALGIAYKESGNLAGAIETFQKFVELVRNLDGYLTLFDVMNETDDFEALAAVLEQASTLFGDEVPLLDRQMGLALRAGWPDKILEVGSKLAEYEPKAWLQVSKITLRQKAYELAETAARRYLDVDPQSWEAFYYLALCRDEQGQHDAAEPLYRKAIEFGRDQWQPYNNLGTNLVDESSPERRGEGVELLLKARGLTPPDFSLPRFNLARGYYRLTQLDKAKDVCRQLLRDGNPEDTIVQTTQRFLAAIEQEEKTRS